MMQYFDYFLTWKKIDFCSLEPVCLEFDPSCLLQNFYIRLKAYVFSSEFSKSSFQVIPYKYVCVLIRF